MSKASVADEFTYENISKRFSDVELDAKTVKRAKMEGECLVGLKNLNFTKKKKNLIRLRSGPAFGHFLCWNSFRPVPYS
jgi:hypothetical protein